MYITDKKLLAHVNEGLIFKKDHALSISYGDITDMSYSEEGIIGKKGHLRVATETKKGREMTYGIKGSPGDIKGAWQALQQYVD